MLRFNASPQYNIPGTHLFSRTSDAEEGGGRDEGDGYDDSDENMDGREYGFVMFDPVWGKPDYPPGHRTTACQV